MATHFSILAWGIPWKRSLAGYSPWGRKESDTTGRVKHTCTHTHNIFAVLSVEELSGLELPKLGTSQRKN